MLTYKSFWGIPDGEVVVGILKLHESVFEESATLVDKIKSKPKVLMNIAFDQSVVVGYKIGYEMDAHKYYSWYGAVHEAYRGQGIAAELMKQQHCLIEEAGYTIVQTKTRNKWRSMLILNIKNGFDVMEVFTDDDGIHRIVLEKKLV
ncbi:GNAT family N-acetyltransferase [Sporosarcina beigongshangi]|uniref:GNAT family N-acetyltransferase n=1 Tax=Sporosarcina beigongshangi TaxID=2782538 RepID=UPI00193AC636|nr:GNAT family N-acetyltransferase [Sporosarcina beigongshangi]